MVPYVDAVVAVTVMRVRLFVLYVCMLKECEDARVTTMIQTTQPTSGGAVTAGSNCCANCVETDLPFVGQAGHADPMDGWRCSS